jgi:hypothetical protein
VKSSGRPLTPAGPSDPTQRRLLWGILAEKATGDLTTYY